MEASAIERELDDLETRIERLRALYEQYFMGIERLEPQIPRKDVERKIHLLRREQIRNTGLRFKFQMLIQRYNTMQQYWARITREIENGIYRRDVMRAAARFGAKDALTILGKKRARQYAALAEAQAQKRTESLSPMGPQVAADDEIEVELDAADFIDESSEEELDGPLTSRNPAPPVPPPTSVGRLHWGPGKPAPPPAASSTAADGADRSGARRRVEELAAAMRAPSTRSSAGSPAGLDLDFDDATERESRVAPVPAPAPSAGKPARFGELALDFEVPAAAPPRPLTAPRPAAKPSAPAAEGPRPVVEGGKTQRKPVLK